MLVPNRNVMIRIFGYQSPRLRGKIRMSGYIESVYNLNAILLTESVDSNHLVRLGFRSGSLTGDSVSPNKTKPNPPIRIVHPGLETHARPGKRNIATAHDFSPDD